MNALEEILAEEKEAGRKRTGRVMSTRSIVHRIVLPIRVQFRTYDDIINIEVMMWCANIW